MKGGKERDWGGGGVDAGGGKGGWEEREEWTVSMG